jgi:hypothetical protein
MLSKTGIPVNAEVYRKREDMNWDEIVKYQSESDRGIKQEKQTDRKFTSSV